MAGNDLFCVRYPPVVNVGCRKKATFEITQPVIQRPSELLGKALHSAFRELQNFM
jgi:hypothetical protein